MSRQKFMKEARGSYELNPWEVITRTELNMSINRGKAGRATGLDALAVLMWSDVQGSW